MQLGAKSKGFGKVKEQSGIRQSNPKDSEELGSKMKLRSKI